MANDPSLDESYGVKSDAPASGDKPAVPAKQGKIGGLDMGAIGAKAYQSMTFGFGADIDGKLFGKQAEQATRELEKRYDKDHPLAAFGIDLAVGAVQASAAAGLKVLEGVNGIVKGVAGGAAYGGLSGAGSGGTLAERGKKAAEGAVIGGATAGAASAAGKLAQPLLDRAGKMGYSQAAKAAESIKAALKSDGKTPQELESFMRQNPGARIADFSPKVADLVGQTGGQSNTAARQLGTNLREDQGGQLQRLQDPSQPLLHVKQQMVDNLKTLEKQRSDAYKSAYSEVVPLTPELKAAMSHPDVKPLVDEVLSDYRKLRMNPGSSVAQAPKYKVGEEIPTAVVDDLQKRMGDAAKDPAAIGKIKAGALQTAQSMLKDAQPDTLNQAQRLAAKIGGEDSKTGIIGAQDWGHQYAFGLGSADVKAFESMNPLQKQYARIGMVSGMESYLRNAGRMTEGSLTKIADKMNSPEIRSVIGDKEANQIKKVFAAEAARARNTTTMASGGSKRAQFHEEDTGRAIAHMANVGIPGAHSVVGTGLRVLKSLGVSEAQAKSIIDIATKPGGMDRLRKAGLSKNVLDKVDQMVSSKSAIAGGMAAREDQQSRQ